MTAKVRLVSSDAKALEVDLAVAAVSQVLKTMIEGNQLFFDDIY
jgi:hypothetical protein